jgi:hypothetical protein
MTRIRSVLFALVGAILLAGCFTSPAPLIGADQAVFPYEKIIFADADRQDDRQTWVRQGDAYSFRPDENSTREAFVRLMPAGNNLYVVQMEFPEDEQMRRLFALVKVDLGAMTAASYSAIIPDNFQNVPGLSQCEDVVCIDSLDAYIAYARAGIEAGNPPDVTYRIISLE